MNNYHELSKQDLASNHHWDELNATGETTFSSDEEDRTISMDEITAECLCDISMTDDIHKFTEQGLEFIYELRKLITAKRNDLMDEALEDYYGV